jgi:WD40 repeat protein
MYVHSVDVSTDGSLVAWGTGDGRIRVSSVSTSEQISCWTAHAGPVMGLHWAKGDLRLLSYGADHRGVDYKLYTRGSYIPREGQKESLNNVVEIWYVGSMVKSAVLKKKKGEGGAKGEGDEQVAGGKDEDEDEDDEDDEDDEEEEEAGKDGGKSKVGRELRKHRRKPQGKIGYTPVYYDPPAKADGTLARSCLKGRGEKRTKKLNFDWGAIPDREDWFFYPPEEPSDEEEESEPEVKPRRRRGGGDRN